MTIVYPGGEIILRKKVMFVLSVFSELQISDFSLECGGCQLEEQGFLVAALGTQHLLS